MDKQKTKVVRPDGARKTGKVIVKCYHFCQMECGSNNVVVATTL
jgi:hypothetical protein